MEVAAAKADMANAHPYLTVAERRFFHLVKAGDVLRLDHQCLDHAALPRRLPSAALSGVRTGIQPSYRFRKANATALLQKPWRVDVGSDYWAASLAPSG